MEYHKKKPLPIKGGVSFSSYSAEYLTSTLPSTLNIGVLSTGPSKAYIGTFGEIGHPYTHPTDKQCNYSVDTSNFVTKDEIEDIGGGVSMYNFLPSWFFDTSGTFTCPVTGTYQVICVGKGGDGGRGGTESTQYSDEYRCSCGAGGGAGAVSVYIGELVANAQYPINITEAATIFNNDWLIANAGGKGQDRIRIYDPSSSERQQTVTGGVGGTCGGTHLTAQYPGLAGESWSGSIIANGTIEPRKGGSCSVYLTSPGINGGAGVGVMPGTYQNGTASYSARGDSDPPTRNVRQTGIPYGAMYGGGGMGGGFAGTTGDYRYSSQSGGDAGKGGPAICLISFIE